MLSAPSSCHNKTPKGPPHWFGWFSPPIFADLRSRNGDQLLPNVRHTLVTLDFAPHAADEIIRVYRANLISFVAKDAGLHLEVLPGSKDELRGEAARAGHPGESSRGPAYLETPLDRVLQFQIAEGTDARIHFRGRPNRPAIKKLIALLELSADTFPA
jgi:hypothetical protein